MNIPPSDHFVPVNLNNTFNASQSQLPHSLQSALTVLAEDQAFRGIPFAFGPADGPNVILLENEPVTIQSAGFVASYLLFVHAVEDRQPHLPADLADFDGANVAAGTINGDDLGDLVSEYQLHYADSTTAAAKINRRFAIQQPTVDWGASPFAAVPLSGPHAFGSVSEAHILGKVAGSTYGWGETRAVSGRDAALLSSGRHLWLYALPNPQPEKTITQLTLVPKEERSVIYAISHTTLAEHPLRAQTRQKLSLKLPAGASQNALAEYEHLAIDMGVIISARARLNYDRALWFSKQRNVQPEKDETEVIVEYAAHPMAKLYVGRGQDRQVIDLSHLGQSQTATAMEPARIPVTIQVIERGGERPVPVRIHLHGESGEYLPPKGNHRRVNPHWFEDNYGEFVNRLNQYAYIPGHCIVDLPQGEIFIEITRGYEIEPIRTSFTVSPETTEITFELDRVLDWRAHGWVAADTHVHFLTPQTALLEGQAEGVHVVNLLASQWGEMFSNVSDFDGHSTIGARDFGGDGEFLVRVGTENRMQVLGHISLLGYSGAMIQPLCSGGPSESAIGDALEVTMADWAQRCIDQNGLVVMPHAPNPQGERAADIVLGLVHAIEMMTFNPFNAQISPYGLADWYRYLNLGYQVPVVGGSDKMEAGSLLGGVRTYAHLGDLPFSYENWMAAVKNGHTFVTVGPLVDLHVDGVVPGQSLSLPQGGGRVDVAWRVDSVGMPIEKVEIIIGGLGREAVSLNGAYSGSGTVSVTVQASTWVAVRVRGSYRGNRTEIAAHTSAVQLIVGDQPLFTEADALAVLEQIEGTIAYVDTLAARPDAIRYKKMRLTLESAHTRLHQRLHRQGIYHKHTPIHDHGNHREH